MKTFKKLVMQKMIDDGIVKRGHFLLTSGNHSHLYVNKDEILLHSIRQDIIELFIQNIVNIMNDVDIVVSPAVAGISWGSVISSIFERPFIYTEKQNDKMVLRKSFQNILKGKNVIIIEDIVSTGSSIKKVIDILKYVGVQRIYASAIWDRMNSKYIKAIFKQRVENWTPEKCPMCKSGKELIDPKTDEVIKLYNTSDVIKHEVEKNSINILLKDNDRIFIYDLDKPYSYRSKIFNGTFKEFKDFESGDECINVGMRITSDWELKFNVKLKLWNNKFCFLDNIKKEETQINLKQL